jgi:type IX secretion system PorP/SprF family membrane protein
MNICLRNYLLIGLLLFGLASIQAQDIHFSQYYNSPMNLSPAQSGLFSEDIRFIAHSKHQWGAVPVNYLTFSGSFDKKQSFRRLRNGLIAKGLLFNYDHAGDSRMTLFQLGGNFAYIKRIGELNLISFGVQLGFRSRFFDDKNLTFDRQFNGEVFNPQASNYENFRNRSTYQLDFGVGLNYRMQLKDKRSYLDFGGAIYHPQEPKVNFLSDAANLYSRKVGYVITKFKINKKMDVVSNVGFQAQGGFNEIFATNAYKYYLKQKKYETKALQMGLTYRFSEREDAVIPNLEFMTDRYRLGLSYDITLSPFKIANYRRGGPEVSFQYLITTVKAVKSFKACPIF